MELLRQTELDQFADNVSCSLGGPDSGNNSEFGSRLSLSATTDMSRVQRCQRKISELEKEAERARQYNRSLMSEFAEQLKVIFLTLKNLLSLILISKYLNIRNFRRNPVP